MCLSHDLRRGLFVTAASASLLTRCLLTLSFPLLPSGGEGGGRKVLGPVSERQMYDRAAGHLGPLRDSPGILPPRV